MVAFEIVSVSGVVVVGIGLIITWVRNGRSSSIAYGRLEAKMEYTQKMLDDPNTGLGAIKKSVDDQKIHCARVSSALQEQVKSLEKRSGDGER